MYTIGIDVGGTNLKAGLVNEASEIVATSKMPLVWQSQEKLAADLAALAEDVVVKYGIGREEVSAIGIGFPGAVDRRRGAVIHTVNIPIHDMPVVEMLQSRWEIPVFLGNDADCAALAESIAGAAKDYDNVLMLTLGTGVGGSFVMNKKIYLGGNGYGCEPGHSILVYNGVQCTCGRRGCLEAYASVTALIRETIEMMAACPTSLMCEMCGGNMSRVSGRTAFDAAKQGDEAALQVVHNYVEYLSAGIGSLVTAFRPSVVILGGGLSNEGEYLLGPVRRRVSETVYASDLMDPPAILKATLGNDAGIIGAALLGA